MTILVSADSGGGVPMVLSREDSGACLVSERHDGTGRGDARPGGLRPFPGRYPSGTRTLPAGSSEYGTPSRMTA